MPVIVAAAPEVARADVPISQQEGVLDDAPNDNSSTVSEVDDASNSSDDS